MLYLKNKNSVFYLIPRPSGLLYFDLYNFNTMTRNDRELHHEFSWKEEMSNLQPVVTEKVWKYNLILDFIGNESTPNINGIIKRFEDYFRQTNQLIDLVDSLDFLIENLKIEDLINLIQNDEFQSLNSAVSSLNSSTWRVYINNLD